MIDWDKIVNGPVMAIFGEEAQYLPSAGSPFSIHGTFHQAYKDVSFADISGVTSESPAFGVQLSEFSVQPKQKDRVVITANGLHGGGTYAVKEVRPNGIGAALLLLNFVSS